MKIIKNVTFEDVKNAFLKDHKIEERTNQYAWERLEDANESHNEKWVLVELSKDDILNNILLPHHIGLIPEEGMPVKDALEIMKNESNELEACCKNGLEKFKDEAFTPVFLSIDMPSKSRADEHKKMKYIDGCLVHLDGLHRLLNWAKSGRLESSEKVKAYVSGLQK